MATALEGLGKAVAEAIALKQILVSLNVKRGDLDGRVNANRKEIVRVEQLVKETERLTEEIARVDAQSAELQQELDTRLTALADKGVVLPLSDDRIKGFVAL